MADSKLQHIKAIVFDLDDTLYPQIEYKHSGFKVVASWMAEKIGINPTIVLCELEKILNQLGASYPYMFDQLVGRLELMQDIVPELIRVFIGHEPKIKCFDGVIPMLERLKKKYRLGILTDGRLKVQQKKVKALGLDEMIDQILYSDALGLEKPTTELFQWFEEKFALKGECFIYVGDNPQKDFYGANQQGWFTVRVMSGEHCNDSPPSSAFYAKYHIALTVDLEEFLKEPLKND